MGVDPEGGAPQVDGMKSVPFGRKVQAQELLAELSARQDMPVSAMLQLTQRCNFRCAHCYQSHPRHPELTTAQWSGVMERLADAGVLFLTLSGGEPLLRDDFVDIAERARELRFALKLKTNGWRLDDPLADTLESLSVMEVHLSFYSSRPSVHDAITGVPGSHDRVMRAARALAARGVGVLMNVPLMNVNADHKDEIIDTCEREGLGWTMDPHLNVCEDGRCSPRELRMTDAQLDLVFADERIFDASAVRGAAHRRTIEDRVCNAGRASCVVTDTGDVLPCPLLQVVFGNVLEDDLVHIWKTSAKRRRIDAIRWKSLPACRDCELLGWCVRCHGAALFEEGDMYGPSRVACQAARARRRAAGGGRCIPPPP
jgi:radical SAM protein with 4Fe4S-binding SPASM domain